MIGIYYDDFIEYLKDNLGFVKESSKSIITVCPFCEVGRKRSHYHLYIHKEIPFFRCFSGNCKQVKGSIKKLIYQISGIKNADVFFDKEKVKNSIIKKTISENINYKRNIILPDLKEDFFKMKYLFIKKRLKFINIPIKDLKGLVFDIDLFIKNNNIDLPDYQKRLIPFFQSNFIGFLTEFKSKLILRNIDLSSTFKHSKIDVYNTLFLDYYKLNGFDKNSNQIIMGEGIFDIYSENLFDTLNLKNNVSMYVSALSTSYYSLIKSIAFNEQIFRQDIHIISDNNISIEYYKKLKKKLNYLINSIIVYFNRSGKDFNNSLVSPEKFVI